MTDNDYREVRGNPYRVTGYKHRFTDAVFVRRADDGIVLGVKDGRDRFGAPSTVGLTSVQAIKHACQIVALADPQVAAFLATTIEHYRFCEATDVTRASVTITTIKRIQALLNVAICGEQDGEGAGG